ncbi:MAG: hypothetical protein QG577_2418 [Thermodesulfobacteriota bacterium]|nr:hypothetical protein [Thermodesulfobacteriota bacterium]
MILTHLDVSGYERRLFDESAQGGEIDSDSMLNDRHDYFVAGDLIGSGISGFQERRICIQHEVSLYVGENRQAARELLRRFSSS